MIETRTVVRLYCADRLRRTVTLGDVEQFIASCYLAGGERTDILNWQEAPMEFQVPNDLERSEMVRWMGQQ